ncbi:MAG: hypothetical protein WA943_05575 [Parvibaculum sp.]|uniref:hypothetical protein n=1 Tax=Parvibaculum sp. TaxID=2024848 RepID=UPI003C7111BA
MTAREKFATQADPELLAQMRALAKTEGRQFQSLVEDAFRTYLAGKQGERPRENVMAHFRDSVRRNAELYKRLAK